MAVFYSFHYDRDYWRVQQVMQMGSLEGQKILNPQEWEAVKRRGEQAIKNWISDQMKYKTGVVVLVGSETASRKWVLHEIAYAWDNYKPLVGIRIHGLADRNKKTDRQGPNPFEKVPLKGGGTTADSVPLFNPGGLTSKDVYANIQSNLKTWVASAYKRS